MYIIILLDADAVNVAFDTHLGGFGLSAVLSVLTGATLLPHLMIKYCKACHHRGGLLPQYPISDTTSELQHVNGI